MLTKKEYAFDRKVLAIHKLRVNIKSLAAEARMIRKEESKCGLQYMLYLRVHRTGRVREEARYANLALAFVRGRKYSQVEAKTRTPLYAERLTRKISPFMDTTREAVEWWLRT